MSLWWKIGIVVAITIMIDLIARSKHAYLSALVPLFPTFAIVAVYSVNQYQPEAIGKFTTTGIGALFAYAAFLLLTYFFSDQFPAAQVVLLGLIGWTMVAAIVVAVVQ